MPTLEYFVVAESVTVDQLTNRVSIFNVYDEIIVPDFPARSEKFVAVCSWNTSENEIGKDFQVGVTIQTPGEEKKHFKTNFTVQAPRHRSIVIIHTVPISKPGTVLFEVQLDGERKASHTIDIRKLQQSEPAVGSTPVGTNP